MSNLWKRKYEGKVQTFNYPFIKREKTFPASQSSKPKQKLMQSFWLSNLQKKKKNREFEASQLASKLKINFRNQICSSNVKELDLAVAWRLWESFSVWSHGCELWIVNDNFRRGLWTAICEWLWLELDRRSKWLELDWWRKWKGKYLALAVAGAPWTKEMENIWQEKRHRFFL